MTQLICFVASEKFFFLSEKFKNTDYGPGSTEILIYKNIDEELYFGGFDHNKAGAAAIVVIPDDFEDFYSPEVDFKLLFHDKTPPDQKNKLLTSTHFKGALHSNETTGSIYQDVAKLLFVNHGFRKQFDEIYEKIKMPDPKISVVINFLHDCLNNQKIITDIASLVEYGVNISFLEGKGFSAFDKICNNLLSQCDFNQENS